MNMILLSVVFIQAILFKLFNLSSRKLQEKGLSPHALIGLERYAIFPAVILFVVTFKQKYIFEISHNRMMILLILGIMFFWIIGEYAGFFAINSTSSLSLLNALNSTINLPMLAVVGILVNHDIPNTFEITSLFFLIVALFIRPSQHNENRRNVFEYQLLFVIGFILIKTLAHDLDGAFYRNLLHSIFPAIMFGISIYILAATVMLNIIYTFKKITIEEKEIIVKNKWLAFSVPIFWFIASLPEGYSFANIPIFTLTTLSSISFLIDIFSDVKNKRIFFNKRTFVFIFFILTSLTFSSISLE